MILILLNITNLIQIHVIIIITMMMMMIHPARGSSGVRASRQTMQTDESLTACGNICVYIYIYIYMYMYVYIYIYICTNDVRT